jgi:hypothetical protein
VSDLRVLTAEPQGAGIVEHLEAVLAQAKAGSISSVAIAFVHRDGAVDGVWSAPPSVGLLLGAISRLGHRLHLEMDQ